MLQKKEMRKVDGEAKHPAQCPLCSSWTPGPLPNVHQMIHLSGVPFPQVSSWLTLSDSNSICSTKPNTWRIPPAPSYSLLSFPCRSNIWYKLFICVFNVCLPQLECKFQKGRALCFVEGCVSKPQSCLIRRKAS